VEKFMPSTTFDVTAACVWCCGGKFANDDNVEIKAVEVETWKF
jgi:hypothetical protein